MKDELVSYEIATGLKAKGFDLDTRHLYRWDFTDGMPNVDKLFDFIKKEFCNNKSIARNEFTAPTLSLAQKWLREEKGIYLVVDYTSRWIYKIKSHGDMFVTKKHNCDTYELALSKGIEEALTLI